MESLPSASRCPTRTIDRLCRGQLAIGQLLSQTGKSLIVFLELRPGCAINPSVRRFPTASPKEGHLHCGVLDEAFGLFLEISDRVFVARSFPFLRVGSAG